METQRTYEVVDLGWSEYRNSLLFEVRCIETGGVVYETDEWWKADVMCRRYNTEGPP